MTIACAVCEKLIQVYPSRTHGNNLRRCCSAECRSIWRKQTHHRYWLGKRMEAISGSNHWNYKQDRTLLARRDERNDGVYVAWRRGVWTRDKWTCRIDNIFCSGRIEAHHILAWKEYPELRYEINNGITLCHAHHPTRRAEEKRLAHFFNELVPVSNVVFAAA